MNIAKQSDWDESYKNFKFYEENDILAQEVDKYIKNYSKDATSIFELGCFPCRYLSHFAKKFKLEANGVDITSEIDKQLFKWLKENDIKVGNIFNADAFEIIDKLKKENKTFDIVYSIGFIEHFTNYLDIIECHDKILKKEGLLIISAPNFRGKIQNKLHNIFDKKNLERHVIEAMNIREWEEYLKEKGYEIIDCKYFGGFKFWHEYPIKNKIKDFICNVICILFNRIDKGNSESYSPYGLVVAKKKD